MNKQQQIIELKRIKAMAAEAKAVAKQNEITATRLESAAATALELLGTKPERARKGDGLSEKDKLGLLASLTRGAKTPLQT